jgi:hypothetical protein
MVNPCRPPLPPNRPFCRPLNYHEYVKDCDLDAHARMFEVVFKVNSETNDA